MNSEDYVKVIYESEPIGKEKIILRLTTFDIEKYNAEQELNNLPKQERIVIVETDRNKMQEPNFRFMLEQRLNYIVNQEYKQQIEELKKEIEFLKDIKIVPMNYSVGGKNE